MYRLLGCAAFAVAASSCSLIVDSDAVQCERNSDCADLGFADSDCVDSLCVPREVQTPFSCKDDPWPSPSTTIVNYSLTVANLVGQTPYEGLTLMACPNLDASCAAPIGMATTDASGSFTIDLEEGFRGHLFAPPPASDPMLAPLKAHLFPPPSNDPSVAVRAGLAVTSLQVVAGLAAMAEVPLVAGNGHVFFTAIDCMGQPLEGVTVTTSVQNTDTFVSYVGASGQPDLSLLGTGASGQGSVLNLPPGFLTVRGVHEDEDRIFEQSVIIAADTITSVPIVPSPAN